MIRTVMSEIASRLVAIENCRTSGNTEWLRKHERTLRAIVGTFLPSGSGFDNGTKIDMGLSTDRCLTFHTSFHHMDENGGYAGWTDHTVRVRATFLGPDITIGGRNRNDIKDYIAEVFSAALSETVSDDFLIKAIA
ncbi:MAG: hypothetical protein KGL39_09575 [Patescibacteria group bacterium]|nr:hypothetical protein [Patescibacteria group bacterium]